MLGEPCPAAPRYCAAYPEGYPVQEILEIRKRISFESKGKEDLKRFRSLPIEDSFLATFDKHNINMLKISKLILPFLQC